MDTYLDVQIVKMLAESDKELSSKQLSFVLCKSSRTIKSRIGSINDDLQSYGAKIESKKGQGYRLVIFDQEKFTEYFEKSNFKEETADNQMINLLIYELVNMDDYIKADDLADKLYISKSKLTSLLNELRKILLNYDLKLDVKPYYGIMIQGSEFNYRRFISSNFVQKILMDDSTSLLNYLEEENELKKYQLDTIEKVVKEQLENHQYTIPSYVEKGLLRHLFITTLRVKKGNSIKFDTHLGLNKHEKEIKVTQAILNELESEFNVVFPASEVEYIAIHLVGKRVFEVSDTISEEINSLVSEILLKIVEIKNIDLLDDLNLRTLLGLHLMPLHTRLQFGIVLENPLVENVREQCLSGYDLAMIATNVIEQKWQVKINRHEISYLALHFDVALKKELDKITRKKILIICESGRASAQMLRYNFEQHFSRYLEEIIVCDSNDINEVLLKNDVDLIFTTVPVVFNTSIPIFEFGFFLNDQNIHKIKSVLMGQPQVNDALKYFPRELFFVGENIDSKEDALNFLFKELRKKKSLPNKFEEYVLEREKFCATDLVRNVAMPHPNRTLTDETFISVLILNKPILWSVRKVRIIFLISMSKQDSEKYKFLIEWMLDLFNRQEDLQHIIEESSYDLLIQGLTNIDWKKDKYETD